MKPFRIPSNLDRLKMAVAYERAMKRVREGLRCPSCREARTVIDSNVPPVIVMSCPACGHRWTAAKPGTKPH
jgi:hypothetical protein